MIRRVRARNAHTAQFLIDTQNDKVGGNGGMHRIVDIATMENGKNKQKINIY